MSEIITFPLPSGLNYTIPDIGDVNWGQNVTNFLVAIPHGVFPTAGLFPLTGDVTLTGGFGLFAPYFRSTTVNPATAGQISLAKTDSIDWRNNANSANLPLAINGSDQLTFNGIVIASGTGNVLSIIGTPNQVIASSPTGNVTLSLPQDIATASSPTFLSLTLTNALTVGAPPNATAGTIRLANADDIAWRNAANTGNIFLEVNSSNQLQYNSHPVFDSNGVLINLGVINVKDAPYSATGNGTTDDTVAIQSAINAAVGGQTVFFPSGNYHITAALKLPAGPIRLLGYNPLSASSGTTITQTATDSIFNLFIGSATDATIQNIEISGFHLVGGNDQIYVQNGGVWVTITDVFFDNPSTAGIFMKGFNQQWFVKNCNFAGGQYGIFLNSAGLQADNSSTGTPPLWDKCNYDSVNFSSATINGVHIELPTGVGGSATFKDVVVNFCAQDGIVLAGGIGNVLFDTLNTESNGFTGSAPIPPMLANTMAGNATVSVSAGGTLVNGQTVTIQGAGVNGVDWYPVIQSGGGTNVLVMTTTAPTSVNAAELVTYLYSDVKLMGTGGGSLYAIAFNNALVGSSSPVAATRYGIDLTGSNDSIVTNVRCVRPMYDPNQILQTSGTYGDMLVRRPNNFLTERFYTSYSGGVGDLTNPRTQLTSPAGKDIVMGLLDSTANTSGTFGNFEIRKSDSSRTKLFAVNGTTGVVTGTITGAIVQAVQHTDSVGYTTTSSTFQTGSSLSITPSSATSKIRVTVTGCAFSAGSTTEYLSIFRGATNLAGSGNHFSRLQLSNSAISYSMSYYDSPATTSSITYSINFANNDNTTAVFSSGASAPDVAYILLEEIAG